MKINTRIEQILGIVAAVLLVIGCGLVLRPFMPSLLWAAILCFSTWPIYQRLRSLLGERNTVAAACMTLLIALIFVLPFVTVVVNLADNVSLVTDMVRGMLAKGLPKLPAWVVSIPFIGERLDSRWSSLGNDGSYLAKMAKQLVNSVGPWLLHRGVALGQGVFELSMSVLIAFFFYRDGVYVAEKMQVVIARVVGDRTQHLLGVVGGTVKGVVYGLLGTAVVQGILAGIGFAIAGVPAPLLLGVLTFFLSLVPVGPPMIWLPAAVWLYYQGFSGWAVFMAIWGFVIVSGVDNILKPYLISRGSSMPFVLVFLGVVGGLFAFGFLGVFLGPTLLAVGYSLMQEWTGQKSSLAADAKA